MPLSASQPRPNACPQCDGDFGYHTADCGRYARVVATGGTGGPLPYEWANAAYAHLGKQRDLMSHDEVQTIQRFIERACQ